MRFQPAGARQLRALFGEREGRLSSRGGAVRAGARERAEPRAQLGQLRAAAQTSRAVPLRVRNFTSHTEISRTNV